MANDPQMYSLLSWSHTQIWTCTPTNMKKVVLYNFFFFALKWRVFHYQCTIATSVQFSSVAQSCLTLWDPMNRSTPGLPVHHQLPEFTQTHIRRVSDAIQPSHPLSSPSPPATNPSQHQGLFMSQLFASGGQSIGVSASASVLPVNTQDRSPLGWAG